jgi:hypothetical protein
LYLLDDESTGLSEVLAIDDQRFLALERDSKAGSKAKIKRIHLVDASQATDVSSVSSFRNGVPNGHRAVSKRLLIDLMLPEYGLSGDATPKGLHGGRCLMKESAFSLFVSIMTLNRNRTRSCKRSWSMSVS